MGVIPLTAEQESALEEAMKETPFPWEKTSDFYRRLISRFLAELPKPEPVCEWVKAEGANYITQRWNTEYVAKLGDKLYTAPPIQSAQAPAAKYGCHCDLEDHMVPDECVIDEGRFEDCIYAKRYGSKEKCPYWRPIKVTPEPPIKSVQAIIEDFIARFARHVGGDGEFWLHELEYFAEMPGTLAHPEAAPDDVVRDADGWVKWKGGECPIKEGECFEVRLANGEECVGGVTPAWNWSHDDPFCEPIVAYRVIDAAIAAAKGCAK